MENQNNKFNKLIELWSHPRYFWRGDLPAGIDPQIDMIQGLADMYCNLPKIHTVVEVGCYRGVSTQVHSCFSNRVYAVDIWPEPAILESFRKRNLANVVEMQMYSNEAAKHFTEQSVDLVYIDADHNYEAVKLDIQLWLPKIRSTGYISGHDYDTVCPGVVKAVNELLGEPDKVYSDSSWIFKLSKIPTNPRFRSN